MRRIGILLGTLLISLAADDLGVIDVHGDRAYDFESRSFEGVFSEPEVIEFEQDVAGLPAQRVLTTKEAMFIPGVQGDPLKALKFQGGVSSISDGSGELYLYASKPEESIFSINHLPVGYLYHGFGIHSVIAPDAIGQINAYLGGFDASYGNAIGGVIDVTPNYPKGDDSGFVHAGIYDASFGMDLRLSDNTSLYVGGRRSYYDLLLSAVGKSTGTLDEDTNTTYTQFPNYYDITALLGYSYDSANFFSLEMVTATDALTLNTTDNAVKDPEAVGKIDADQSFITLGLRHQGYYGDYRTNTVAYNMYSKSRAEFFDGFFVDNIFNMTGLFHQSTLDYGSHRFIFGAQADYFVIPLDMNISKPPRPDDVDYDFTTAEKYRINETYTTATGALFAEDVYTLTPQWSVRYGGRVGMSDYTNLGLYADPRAGVVYTTLDDTHFSVSGGRYTRVPSGYKLADDLGNPDLGYERAWHLLLHADAHVGSGATVTLEPFYKWYEDLAIDDNLTQYSSSGEGYAYGFDLSAKYRSDAWYFYGTYTYIRSERELTAQSDTLHRFYAEVPHTLQLLGSWRFAREWALSGLVKYHSGKPYTPVIGTYMDNSDPQTPRLRPIYGDPFSKRLDEYFTLNLKIAQEITFSDRTRLEWSFELMNATNHENVSDILYNDDYSVKGYVTQLPLLPWFDVTYRF